MKQSVEMKAMFDTEVEPLIDMLTRKNHIVASDVKRLKGAIRTFAYNYHEARRKRLQLRIDDSVFEQYMTKAKDWAEREVIEICQRCGEDPALIFSRSKGKAGVVAVRHLCVYLLIESGGYSSCKMKYIGNVLGGRDRATAYHSYKTAKALLSIKDPLFIRLYNAATKTTK